MGNPTRIDGELAVLVAGTTEKSVALNVKREYTLAHDSEDAAGDAATNTIYLATDDGSTVADATAGKNKFKLLAGRSVVIGPDVSAIKFRTAAGAPTFSVSPSPAVNR